MCDIVLKSSIDLYTIKSRVKSHCTHEIPFMFLPERATPCILVFRLLQVLPQLSTPYTIRYGSPDKTPR